MGPTSDPATSTGLKEHHVRIADPGPHLPRVKMRPGAGSGVLWTGQTGQRAARWTVRKKTPSWDRSSASAGGLDDGEAGRPAAWASSRPRARRGPQRSCVSQRRWRPRRDLRATLERRKPGQRNRQQSRVIQAPRGRNGAARRWKSCRTLLSRTPMMLLTRFS